jgi:hypothetical protein
MSCSVSVAIILLFTFTFHTIVYRMNVGGSVL